MMREIQEKQEWLRNFYMKTKGSKLPFAGKYNIKHDPVVVANDIRKTLGISIKDKPDKPLKYWIGKAEEKRIFIALSSNFHTRLKLNSDVFKGFVIADPFAPFIFLNSDDWDQGQLFTLVHELAHIWIGVSGMLPTTRRCGASSRETSTTAYGTASANPGLAGWCTTVKLCTVPSPPSGRVCHSNEWHSGQEGEGGLRRKLQLEHFWISTCSASRPR